MGVKIKFVVSTNNTSVTIHEVAISINKMDNQVEYEMVMNCPPPKSNDYLSYFNGSITDLNNLIRKQSENQCYKPWIYLNENLSFRPLVIPHSNYIKRGLSFKFKDGSIIDLFENYGEIKKETFKKLIFDSKGNIFLEPKRSLFTIFLPKKYKNKTTELIININEL